MRFIGNQKIISLLSRSLENGRINHAYLFSGPEHVGKYTLARAFALGAILGNEINLKSEDKNALLDLIVIKPGLQEKKGIIKQKDISIEDVRDAKQGLSLFPYAGKRKVLVIDDAHKMSIAAQNALLKILEEPSSTTLIILVSSESDRLLATIKSRVQTVNFSLAEEKEIREFFNEEVVDYSAGRPGLASLISASEEEISFFRESKEQLVIITSGTMGERLDLAEKLSKDVSKTLDKLNFWVWKLRDKIEGNHVKIERIQKAVESLKKTNASPRLVLENLFLGM